MEACEREGLSSQRGEEIGQSTGAARVSIAGLCSDETEERDSADRIEAAEALDSLKDHRPVESQNRTMPGFISQIQTIPLVSSALEIYDRSKQNSAIIRVGGGAIETGVRRMCQPIAKRIDVSQLDSFACRQLSNLGYGTSETVTVETAGNNLRKRKKDQADAGAIRVSNDSSTTEQTLLISEQSDRRSEEGAARSKWGVGNLVASAKERAVAYREDSMRRLRYCLEWVAYATALLRQHMHELRQMLAGLQALARAAFGKHEGVITVDGAPQERAEGLRGMQAAAQQLAVIRRELVVTVRKAVGVVSQYAGSVLPGEARRQVRGMILGLPRRWSMVDPTTAVGSCSSSAAASSVGSDDYSNKTGDTLTPVNVEATARRTLAFATESFYMLDGVKSIFSGLQTNAERWWIGSESSPVTTQPVQMEQVESNCLSTAYRDPTQLPLQREGIYHSGSEGIRIRRPLRNRRETPSSPLLTAQNNSNTVLLDKQRSTTSLIEIGEQMRKMDMQQSPESNNKTINSVVDKNTSKRSCTRETTPTRDNSLAFSVYSG
ncbi:hypothetical protein COEREDRAFT_10297 [Coemansia reversa NRRL 1564]|uniref:Opi1-domain-containing protein n=1 Tax=Coemansia reversa (strain ATCC 12441 / NRRL 1564) TaxID=763665 RepID=A0A2G5B6E2_COERN|nr:hypothetical protein COEREDRAFT_10297 [Coemansia reversa NRRL 1564]|eukprot:PIA14564.1 hypothetical protein COEREDRAFT_10297 [Coemansia reversa NRRL 1564]